MNEGDANVTVYLKTDSRIRATCKVHVRRRIPVESISFPVPELTMNVNNTMKLGVIVSPSNATNRKVYWNSCCPDIATVDSEGVVRPQSPGVVDIYATTEDRNLTAKCTITIEQYVPVKSIRFGESELTLKKSQTKKLTAIVEPSNATYPQVIWHSCCPDVATVDSSGKITPHSTGYADIYATTVDGNFTAYCTVRVVIENVTIKQQGIFLNVEFEDSNKTWQSIGRDIVYNPESATGFLIDRCTENLFEKSTGTPKEYTDDELRLLYAIDPHGVASYISRYAHEVVRENPEFEGDEALKKMVEYKDNKYEAIFRKKPKYYKRIARDTYKWVESDNNDNIAAVLSQSESLFGIRKVWDEISEFRRDNFAAEMINSYFSCETTMDIIVGNINEAVKIYNIISMIGEDGLAEEVVKYAAEKVVDEIYESVPFLQFVVDVYNGIKSIDEVAVVNKDFCPIVTYYYAYDSAYDISIKKTNDDNVTLNQIYNDLIK
ncbi:MAG: Ig-like domain-containing protein [Clostridia bacterium]|nr:Ig-like domain-containing protein [Clostridia bacterium]